jgi:hypothetical protein
MASPAAWCATSVNSGPVTGVLADRRRTSASAMRTSRTCSSRSAACRAAPVAARRRSQEDDSSSRSTAGTRARSTPDRLPPGAADSALTSHGLCVAVLSVRGGLCLRGIGVAAHDVSGAAARDDTGRGDRENGAERTHGVGDLHVLPRPRRGGPIDVSMVRRSSLVV